jgi:hypothetical protein
LGQLSGFSAVSASPGATTSAVAACAGGGAGTGAAGGLGRTGGVGRRFPGRRKGLEGIGDRERDAVEVLARSRIGEGEAADRRARGPVLVEPRVEFSRPLPPGDDEEGVRLDRLVGDLAGRRLRGEARVERAEVGVGARGEIEHRTVLVAHELGRRADPRAGLRVGDHQEAGRRARLLTRRKQGLELAGREDAVAGRLLARLEGGDRVARAPAEIAVARAVVKPEPDERVLRGLAGCKRQRQERRLLRGEGRLGGGRGGRCLAEGGRSGEERA